MQEYKDAREAEKEATTRISDSAVVPYPPDPSSRLDSRRFRCEGPRHGGWHAVGEKENGPFQFTFNGFLKVSFQGTRVTSDAGLLLVRELDERLGLRGTSKKLGCRPQFGSPLRVS